MVRLSALTEVVNSSAYLIPDNLQSFLGIDMVSMV